MNELPPPEVRPRPWYRSLWGIILLMLLGLAFAIAGMEAVASTMWPQPGDYQVALMYTVIVLDVLVAITIAVALVNRRFLRWEGSGGWNFLVGLILWIVCTASVIVFLFFGCAAVVFKDFKNH